MNEPSHHYNPDTGQRLMGRTRPRARLPGLALMFSLNRNMQYSLLDTTWFTLMWIDCLLSVVVLMRTAEVLERYQNTAAVVFPGGYWEIVAFIASTALLSALLITMSKKEINKLATGFFATGAPLFVTATALFQLYSKL